MSGPSINLEFIPSVFNSRPAAPAPSSNSSWFGGNTEPAAAQGGIFGSYFNTQPQKAPSMMDDLSAEFSMSYGKVLEEYKSDVERDD
jgi:hypothetical protein